MDSFNNAALSIIVPLYNCESYIEECLTSLFNQGFNKNDYEIVVVDDGSTDNSATIVNHLSKVHKEIKLIRSANLGVSSARNIGIRNSSGKYIMFVDADDYIYPNSLKKIVDIMDENEVKAFKFNFTRNHTTLNGFDGSYKIVSDSTIAISTVWQIIFSRSTIQENNLEFDIRIKYSEDNLFVFLYLIHEKGKIAYSCNDKIYYYRQHQDQTVKKIGIYGIANTEYCDSVLKACYTIRKIAFTKDKMKSDVYKIALSVLMCSFLWNMIHSGVKPGFIRHKFRENSLHFHYINITSVVCYYSKNHLFAIVTGLFKIYIIFYAVSCAYKIFKKKEQNS